MGMGDTHTALPLEEQTQLRQLPQFRQAVDELLCLGWDIRAAEELAALYVVNGKKESS